MKNKELLRVYRGNLLGVRRLSDRPYFVVCIRIGKRCSWWYDDRYY